MSWKGKYRRANNWSTRTLGIKAWGIPYLALCLVLRIPPDLEAIEEHNPLERKTEEWKLSQSQ